MRTARKELDSGGKIVLRNAVTLLASNPVHEMTVLVLGCGNGDQTITYNELRRPHGAGWAY